MLWHAGVLINTFWLTENRCEIHEKC